MRTRFTALLILAFAGVLRAEIVTASSTTAEFGTLTFDNGVMRAFRNNSPIPLAAGGEIFIESTSSSYFATGDVLRIDFDVPVKNVTAAILKIPVGGSNFGFGAVGIDERGQWTNVDLSTVDSLVPLTNTSVGLWVRSILIFATEGSFWVNSIQYETKRLTPGQLISGSNILAGDFRDTYINGCKGRTLELTAQSFDPDAAVRYTVGPADDGTGEHTKSQDAKIGKARKFKLDEPSIYRVRIENLGSETLSSIEVATSESFDSDYDKTKFVIDPPGNLTTADGRFSALADTDVDISVKRIGDFEAPIGLELLEGGTDLKEADLSNSQTPTANGVACLGVPIRKGGPLRLRCSNLGAPSNKLQVTVKRGRPLPGSGVLEL